jgi:hypothetical protein
MCVDFDCFQFCCGVHQTLLLCLSQLQSLNWNLNSWMEIEALIERFMSDEVVKRVEDGDAA